MSSDRCPSCTAVVRKDSDWCSLCYADLRPARLPVARAPYPQPSAPPAYAAPPPAAAQPAADALGAPYEHVLAAVYGGAGTTTAQATLAPPAEVTVGPAQTPAKAVGWPCVQCSEINDFERMSCAVCMAPFGGNLRTNLPSFDRKKIMIYAVAAAVAFLVLVGGLTFALTKRPDVAPDVIPSEQSENVVQDPAVQDPPAEPSVVPGQPVSPDQPADPNPSGDPRLVPPVVPSGTATS